MAGTETCRQVFDKLLVQGGQLIISSELALICLYSELVCFLSLFLIKESLSEYVKIKDLGICGWWPFRGSLLFKLLTKNKFTASLESAFSPKPSSESEKAGLASTRFLGLLLEKSGRLPPTLGGPVRVCPGAGASGCA